MLSVNFNTHLATVTLEIFVYRQSTIQSLVKKLHKFLILRSFEARCQDGETHTNLYEEHTARPVLPKPPLVLAKALKPRLVFRRKLGAVTENFFDHAKFMHMQRIYK